MRTDTHPGDGTMHQVVYSFAKSEYTNGEAVDLAMKAAKAEQDDWLLHKGCELPGRSGKPSRISDVNMRSDCSDMSPPPECAGEHWRIGVWFTIKKKEPQDAKS